ncbi:MAG TPA: hypothetical protein VGM25_07475 [Caulobacteraceae bacterium]|jgi:hypothetical protein
MIALIAAAALAAADPSPLLPPRQGTEEVQPPIQRAPPGGVPPLMPIYGVSVGGQGVTVQLPAGCNLTKADFTVAISRSADRPTILIARRGRAGSLVLCPRQPGIDVTWTYADLGLSAGQPFSLANPLVKAP